jgi:hypothetical protein
MFKNNVFKVSVDTKKWLKAASLRSLKTFAQSFASLMTVGAAVNEINWGYIASVSLVSAVYSIVTSIAGLPEVKEGEQ